MSGVDLLLDTNALLYLLRGYACMQPYFEKQYGISVISEMELLSFSQNNKEDERHIQSLIDDCMVFELNNAVKNQTISIRTKLNNCSLLTTHCSLKKALPDKR